MKKLLSSVALIAGLSMIALPASAQASGHVGAEFGTLTADSGGTETDLDYLGVGGSVAFPVGSGLVAQINASLGSIDGGGTEVEQTGVSANLGIRNAQYAIAGYVGFKDSDTVDTGFLVGGEYQHYMPQMTLVAGGGFGTFDDADADVFGLEGELRYFFNDNLRLDGGVYYSKIEVGAGGEADGFGGGVGIEWKPDNFPISVFGGYGHGSLRALGRRSLRLRPEHAEGARP
jgi:hypothetical protein